MARLGSFGVLLWALAWSLGCSDKKSSPVAEVPTDTIPAVPALRPVVGPGPVGFNELDAHNISLTDHLGEDPGWVEFYNSADTAVNLQGLRISLEREDPAPWVLGNIIVPPEGYAVVMLSGIDTVPDQIAFADTLDLMGTNVWAWSDNRAEPMAGASSAEPWAFASFLGSVDGRPAVSAELVMADNGATLGWSSSCLFLGFPGGGTQDNPVDLSQHSTLILKGEIQQGRTLEVRLAQQGTNDWEGWATTLVGDGQPHTTYSVALPPGSTFPDLSLLYGIRFAPPSNQFGALRFTITEAIAVKGGRLAHAGVRVRKNGGALWLSDARGILDSLVYPATPAGGSWGRDSLGRWGHLLNPTPGGANLGEVISAWLPEARVATRPGFYEGPVLIALEPVAGAELRYTLDGAEPTEVSAIYQAPIRVDTTTVIRFAAFREGALRGPISSHTYFVGVRHGMAVVSLQADPRQLFDPDTGIYVMGPNAGLELPHFGANFWQDKELRAAVEFFESNGARAWGSTAGIKIFGNWSRAQAKKSWAVRFREEYGMASLDYELWPGQPTAKPVRNFLLRNNGNNAERDYVRDALAHGVAATLGIEGQKYRPAVVYINGQYFGIYDIREKLNANYFEANFGFDRRMIDLIKPWNEVQAGSAVEYRDLESFVEENDPADAAAYSEVQQRMDVNNFMDYVSAQVYFNNTDWPANNIKRWRSTAPVTLWRWALYDVDFGFGAQDDVDFDMFPFITATDAPDWPNGPESTLLLRRLLRNEEFRGAFINRTLFYIAHNFSTSQVLARLESMLVALGAEPARDQARWGTSAANYAENESVIRNFIQRRPGLVRAHLADFFGFTDSARVQLAVEGNGQVLLHGRLIPSGVSAVFYAEQPLLLEAQGAPGSVFQGWSDGETAARRLWTPVAGSLTANF